MIDLRDFSDAQAGLLLDIDVQEMGNRLRELILDATPSDQQEIVASTLDSINLTTQTQNLVREDIYREYLGTLHTSFGSEPELRADLLEALAFKMGGAGLFAEEIDALRAALTTRRELFGTDHPETIRTLSLVCVPLVYLDQFDEASPLLTELREQSDRVLGQTHPTTLTALDLSATMYTKTGSLGQAERVFQSIVEAQRASFGPDDPRVSDTLRKLGVTFAMQGKMDDAERVFVEAAENVQRMADPPLEVYVPTMMNLAVLRSQQGRYQEAVELLRRCDTLSSQKAGEDHPETLTIRANLASNLRLSGRHAEAAPLARDTIARTERQYGKAHPKLLPTRYTLLNAMLALGMEALDEGRRVEAVKQFAVARQIALDHGPDLSETDVFWELQLALADALGPDPDRVDEAEQLLLEAVEILRPDSADSDPQANALVEELDSRVASWYLARDREHPNRGFAAKAAEWTR